MFNPTPQQSDAIKTKGCVLVTAAAGSGKTAVLTERVVRMICDTEKPVSVDRLLIVTFTNAAAAEMRLRIEKRLNEIALERPDNRHISRQLLLLPSAKICTIDSFCINLVRDNFEALSVAPDFKMIQGAELNLIYDRAFTSTLDWFYKNCPDRITDLLSALQSNFGDSDLIDPVNNLYKFICNLPFPERWLEENRKMYLSPQSGAFSLWKDYLLQDAKNDLNQAYSQLLEAFALMEKDERLYAKYGEGFKAGVEQFGCICDPSRSSGEVRELCAAFELAAIKTRSGTEAEKLSREARNRAVNAAKNYVETIAGSDEVLLADLAEMAPHTVTWLDITEHYYNEVFKIMCEENVLTFHNTEQLALSLLCKREGDKLVMSDAAAALSEEFDEILVDEYQDTNDLQDTLFYMLSNCGKKLFSVGDVKQSIYGFRGANPENFVAKKESYIPLEIAKEDDRKKIVLSSNFRSRKGICGFINYFFSLIMSKELGGVEYNAEERLNDEASFPECPLPETEVHILETADEDERKAEQFEAEHIAAYIKNTVGKEPFLRDGEGGLRPAKYGDFAVLLRSPGSHSQIYLEKLQQAGIPARFETSGFLKSKEISSMLSLLKTISNPTHDVPLIALMMSPVFGFSAEEVSQIRLYNRASNFYSALLTAEKEGHAGAVRVCETLRKYRRDAVTTPPEEFVLKLCKETGLIDSVSALSDGERRRNNLLLLCNMAEGYFASGGTLSSFVAYVEKIGDDIKTPSGGGGDDCVKIVSFHGSKGLQYPVCIVAGCFREFFRRDLSDAFLYSRDYGVSLKAADSSGTRLIETVARGAIIKHKKANLLSEELRVLYVAMTRAEERLVVVLAADKMKNAVENVAAAINDGADRGVLQGTNKYLNWFLYALLRNADCENLRTYYGVNIAQDCLQTGENCRIKTVIGTAEAVESDAQEEKTVGARTAEKDEILSRINYRYPYEQLSQAAAKTSVSEITHKSSEARFDLRPAFVSKAGLTPAQRGTATHKFMQFADYFEAAADCESELSRLVLQRFISKEEADAIDRKALSQFFASDVFSRMENCIELHREMRFLTEIPVSELYGIEGDDVTVVQGVIDCVIEEEDGISVLDFKTDRVSDEGTLSDMYRAQVEIYAEACKKMFKKPIKDKMLYSFALGKIIKL